MSDNQNHKKLTGASISELQPTDERQFNISKTRQVYNSPTPGELPLIAVGIHENQEEFLKLIKECGFHCFQSPFNPHNGSPSLKVFLDLSKKHHMKQIIRLFERDFTKFKCDKQNSVSEEELKNHLTESSQIINEWNIFIDSWKKMVKEFWNHEACAGYQISDEFPINKIGWLSCVKDIIVENDPLQGMAFTGLYPEWVNLDSLSGDCKNHLYVPSWDRTQLKGTNYQAFLDEYQTMFKPAVWLFDCYYVRTNEKPATSDTDREPTFFTNLDLIRRKAIEDNRPFWTTVRCLYRDFGNDQTQQNNIKESVAEMIDRTMQIECFSALAYGAKGMLFWAVLSRPGEFSLAPIQQKRHESNGTVTYGPELFKTTLFPKVQKLISELRKYEYLFLKSTVKRIGSRGTDNSFGIPPLDSYPFGPISMTRTAGKFLMAYHQTPSSEFVVFVNISLLDPSSLTVESPYKLKELTLRGTQIPPMPIDLEIENEKTNSTVIQKAKVVTSITTIVQPGDWRIFYRDLQ